MNSPVPPDEFICPLTKQLMAVPVVSRYGIHFEKKAILEWLNDGNNFCPVTGNPLRPSNLISDPTLRWKIQYWAKKNAGRDLAAERKERGEDEEAESNVLSMTGFVHVPSKKFYCPLTKDIMEDPVVTREGIRFERSAIMKWFEDKGDINPVTQEKLYPSDLITDTKLQWEIRQWNLQHGDAAQEMTRLELETKLNKASMVSRDFHISDILRALTENVEAADTKPPSATGGSEHNKKPPAMPDRANVLDVLDEVVGALELDD